MRFLLSIIVITAFAAHAIAEKPKLPEPPDGFTWQWCEDVHAAFLRPKEWHFKHSKKNETHGYFITKEKIKDDDGEFTTGLTVNVIPGVGKKSGGAKIVVFPSRFGIPVRSVGSIRLKSLTIISMSSSFAACANSSLFPTPCRPTRSGDWFAR